jgi:hypothetical protein
MRGGHAAKNLRQQPVMQQLLEHFFGLKVPHLTGYLGGVAFCNTC